MLSLPQTHCPLTPRILQITIVGIKGKREGAVARGTGYVEKKKRQKKIDRQGTVFLVGT